MEHLNPPLLGLFVLLVLPLVGIIYFAVLDLLYHILLCWYYYSYCYGIMLLVCNLICALLVNHFYDDHLGQMMMVFFYGLTTWSVQMIFILYAVSSLAIMVVWLTTISMEDGVEIGREVWFMLWVFQFQNIFKMAGFDLFTRAPCHVQMWVNYLPYTFHLCKNVFSDICFGFARKFEIW